MLGRPEQVCGSSYTGASACSRHVVHCTADSGLLVVLPPRWGVLLFHQKQNFSL